jgi:hypothetical protein
MRHLPGSGFQPIVNVNEVASELRGLGAQLFLHIPRLGQYVLLRVPVRNPHAHNVDRADWMYTTKRVKAIPTVAIQLG